MTLLLLAGTGEAVALAKGLADGPTPVIASLAGATRLPRELAVKTRSGGFGGDEGFQSYLREAGITAPLYLIRSPALGEVEACIELADGSRHLLVTTTAEPGFGFFSFTPHREDGDLPKRVVVPIGAVRSIEISAPDPERPFGFTATD